MVPRYERKRDKKLLKFFQNKIMHIFCVLLLLLFKKTKPNKHQIIYRHQISDLILEFL